MGIANSSVGQGDTSRQPLLSDQANSSGTELATFVPNDEVLRKEFPTLPPLVVESIAQQHPNLEEARSVCREMQMANAYQNGPRANMDEILYEFNDLSPEVIRQITANISDPQMARQACQNARVFNTTNGMLAEFPTLSRDFVICVVGDSSIPSKRDYLAQWATAQLWSHVPDPSGSAVTGVEGSEGLIEILSTQLQSECKAQYPKTLEVVQKLIQNILNNMEEPKFRQIKLVENTAIYNSIGKFPIASLLMQELGFLPTAENPNILFMETPNLLVMTQANEIINKLRERQRKYAEALTQICPSKRRFNANPYTNAEQNIRKQLQERSQTIDQAFRPVQGTQQRYATTASQAVWSKPKVNTKNLNTYVPIPSIQSLRDFYTEGNLALRVLILVNEARRNIGRGFKPLIWNGQIANLAQRHSLAMATNRQVDHQGYQERISQINFRIVFNSGETISSSNSYDPAKTAVDDWAGTQATLALITGEFTMAGVGVARGPEQQPYWYVTQILVNAI